MCCGDRKAPWEATAVVQEEGGGGLGLCPVLAYKKQHHPGKSMI